MASAEPERFEKRITIVCGPSNCGKSTYLARLAQSKIDVAEIPVVMAHEYDKSSTPQAPLFLHYNTLRAMLLASQSNQQADSSECSRQNDDWNFDSDPIWRDVLASKPEKQAILILTPRNELLKRIERREFVEPVFGGMQPYPSLLWLDQYRHIDLAEHYRSWLDELESNEIPVHGVDGTSSEFNPVADLRAAISALA